MIMLPIKINQKVYLRRAMGIKRIIRTTHTEYQNENETSIDPISLTNEKWL